MPETALQGGQAGMQTALQSMWEGLGHSGTHLQPCQVVVRQYYIVDSVPAWAT